jgi:aquaporin PIP
VCVIVGGHINPAGGGDVGAAAAPGAESLALSLPRAALYVAAQCLGAATVCGAGLVRATHSADAFARLGGGEKAVGDGYGRVTGLAAEVVGTSVLVYTVFSATVAKRNARGNAKV